MSNRRSNRTRPGVTGQLLRVYVLQMLFISAITVLGVYLAAKVVEGVMMRTALEGEAEHFWNLYLNEPGHGLPNTDNLRGYLERNGDQTGIPVELIALEQGFGRVRIDESEPLVYVDSRGESRLFLVFDEQSVSKLSFYFGVVPLSLALIILYISAWFAYRQSRKAVSPFVQLAKIMREFDIDTQRLEDLELDEFAARPGNSEVNVLVDALEGFTDEINQLLDRERRFTRDASHELRTPLTVIQGSAEWLRKHSDLDDKQRQALNRILKTVAEMIELVEALLLLARGVKKGFRTEEVEMYELVSAIVEEIEITHNADNRVKTSITGNPNLVVECSPQGAYMVISNLVRNAYNYTDTGPVNVVLDENSVTITNHGRMPEGVELSELFKPFVRGPSEPETKGYGIGLDLVTRLCDHFRWQVTAEYAPKDGMRFDVQFSPEAH